MTTAEVITSQQVVITETAVSVLELTASTAPAVVQVVAQGPQGPASLNGTLVDLADVQASGKIDRSLLYYDAGTGLFKADATVTTTTLTDGGNF